MFGSTASGKYSFCPVSLQLWCSACLQTSVRHSATADPKLAGSFRYTRTTLRLSEECWEASKHRTVLLQRIPQSSKQLIDRAQVRKGHKLEGRDGQLSISSLENTGTTSLTLIKDLTF